MTDLEYPTRCVIRDIEGDPLDDTGLVARTPEVSRQYIGQRGLAEKVPDSDSIFGESVRITLDSGDVIWGYECWWSPLPEERND